MQSTHPTLRPVGPNECALAIAIPLIREEFLDDLARPGEKDLVHHFRRQRGLQKAAPEFCWEVYARDEAAFAETVCTEVERLGVTVCRRARLVDLTRLVSEFPVVTLLAHWRFVKPTAKDVLNAPRMLQLLRSPENSIQQLARDALEVHDNELLQADANAQDNSELCRRVAQVIGTISAEAEKLYWEATANQEFDPEQMEDRVKGRLTRSEFEYAFPGCLAPARSIEFGDCLRTVDELIEAIPDGFDGLLDFTMCNSVIPAAQVRSKRSNCVVAANRHPAELRARLYLYGLQVSLLAKQPMPFMDVVKEVHTNLSSYNSRGRELWNLFDRFFRIFRKRH